MCKELPILFNGDMVNAILEGRKTQTRRIVKPAKDRNGSGCQLAPCEIAGAANGGDYFLCPYGQPGDQLYVKEMFYAWGRWVTEFDEKKGRDAWRFIDMTMQCGKEYQFSQPVPFGTRAGMTPAWHKRPSLFMPRIASRTTLEIISVRVERLQDISESDAKAEGVASVSFPNVDADRSDVDRFRALWNHINGAGSWNDNPWVWMVEFKSVEVSQ